MSRSYTFDTMFVWSVCMLTLIHMSSACSVSDAICTNLTAVQEEIVNLHNAFRRSVVPQASNMLKMSWSKEAAVSAQNWVNTCSMKHGPPSTRMLGTYEMGENLFKSTGMFAWTAVVTAWHSEVVDYEYPTGSINGEPIGHYTQVVWYGSYEVGCGVAKCGSNYFYACHYYRAGNFKGVPPYSKGEPCSACPDACEDGLCTNPCPYIDRYANCPSIKEDYTCEDDIVKKYCPAICLCENKVIPIAKK
ncbi:serotriflin isoform X2 [Pygocentrus nattereri]|uniref:serotriflin isoform X2 n=1 Tax=Pygocentrus nattereri TaxID=42514 RepID=UPI001891783D|nr:serotriflin isoform X2 [Pygocentrus nattereri]